MANFERSAGSDSRQEPKAKEILRRDRLNGSPRASLAFLALNASDWARETFGRLLSRLLSRISKKERRSEPAPEVITETSRVHPVIIGHVLLALACVSAKPCLAGTIYNNLGPNNTFSANQVAVTTQTYLATNFTATDGGRLDTILAPLSSLASPVTIALYADSNGQPGKLLESWNANLPPDRPPTLTVLTSVLHPSMFAQTKYWFVITQAQATEVEWWRNSEEVREGPWSGNSLNALTQEVPEGDMPAIQVLSVTESPAGCKSTYKSGSGPTFLQFCVTANGNVIAFQSPAGTLHFLNSSRTEGYGFCDVNRMTSYFDYDAGEESGNWDTPVINQPKGPNTFPLEIARSTADGAFTLTQSFSRGDADRSANVSMSLRNNTGFGKKIFLLRFGHLVANAASPDPNYYDLAMASGSVWAYDRLGSGVMLSAAPTSFKHLGLVFWSDSAPDPCNFSTTVLNPVADPDFFPYKGVASMGTVHSFSVAAGKSVTVGVGYRPF